MFKTFMKQQFQKIKKISSVLTYEVALFSYQNEEIFKTICGFGNK